MLTGFYFRKIIKHAIIKSVENVKHNQERTKTITQVKISKIYRYLKYNTFDTIINAEPYFFNNINITTFITCSSVMIYKAKNLYEQMLREDKADTYKQKPYINSTN